MPTFQLIIEARTPIAAIIPRPVSPDHRDTIYALLPENAVMNFELSKRWSVWAVLCSPDRASAQLHRKPMLRPKGQPITIGE